MTIFDAAMKYKEEGIPLIIMAGSEYGTGSSRDWAAKGTLLLGVRAVIAKSFERIHRSNLIGMGVLPLQFLEGEGASELGLTGREVFFVQELENGIQPQSILTVKAEKEKGPPKLFQVTVRLDTSLEVEYYLHGGILPMVLRNMS